MRERNLLIRGGTVIAMDAAVGDLPSDESASALGEVDLYQNRDRIIDAAGFRLATSRRRP